MEVRFMASNNNCGNSKIFALFAGKNYSLWEKIIGYEVKHNVLGMGRIVEVIELKSSINIKINFMSLPENKRSKIFSNTTFLNNYPEDIEFDHFLIPGFNDFMRQN